MLVKIEQAIAFCQKGEIFAMPTDTVYGIAAAINRQEAIDMLYEIKGRAASKQLMILASSSGEIKKLFDDSLHSIIDQACSFWPGALSLVLPCKENNLGYATLGVRIPDHPVALELLRVTGPLYVTSANPSGEEAAKTPEKVAEYFGADFPVLSGKVKDGVPSTIIKIDEEKMLLIREGSIDRSQLQASFPDLLITQD